MVGGTQSLHALAAVCVCFKVLQVDIFRQLGGLVLPEHGMGLVCPCVYANTLFQTPHRHRHWQASAYLVPQVLSLILSHLQVLIWGYHG